MFALLIHQRVSDICVWKTVFEEDQDARRAYGAIRDHVFRQESDPSEMMILLEWDDPDRARLYSQSDDLRELFARSGAIGQPGVWVLHDHLAPLGAVTSGQMP